ncbi:SAF domain-containing protein [Kineococcus rhizosphaerae]|uniref:SAF domain-containing protein n=1 Tax=Kineococcus rhizosphaerae TaxID=559628 RepID=A0A2T0QWR1_9ACTN|nr:SAF domain-containing protein [Kineococcus rhizosphaerae]PRY09908.1 SAF domain-containing protein [Kineococcus rhizosphaerae]
MSTTTPGSTNGRGPAANRGRRSAPATEPATTTRGVPVQPAAFRPQRRARHLLAAVALAGLGAVAVYFAVEGATKTTSVVEVRESVQRGQTITREDLTTVDVNGTGLKTVPAAQLKDLIGQRAQQPLFAGTLLTPEALNSSVVPVNGQSLVGVALTSAQMPTEPLVAGDTVSIVDTPNSNDANSQVPAAPNTTSATVQNVGTPDTQGVVTVDVLVPEGDAARLAAQASTGRVALVLQSRER